MHRHYATDALVAQTALATFHANLLEAVLREVAELMIHHLAALSGTKLDSFRMLASAVVPWPPKVHWTYNSPMALKDYGSF